MLLFFLDQMTIAAVNLLRDKPSEPTDSLE